jgi:hypothetical protein
MSPAQPPAPPLTLTLPDCLEAIASRLAEAARVTGAALACAQAGAEKEEAVRLVLDVERHTYEADKLLAAVTVLARIRRERGG